MQKDSKQRAAELKRQMAQLQSQLEAVENGTVAESIDEYFAYVRLSTNDQLEGSGDDRQIKSIKAYCKKEKVKISKWLEDDGKSGFHAKNLSLTAELGALIEKVKYGEIVRPIIIAETMSRITRINSEEAVQYILDLTTQHDITFITTVDSMVYKKGEMGMIGVIKLTAYSEASHAESLEKRKRTLGAYEKEVLNYQKDKSYVFMHTPPSWIKKVKPIGEDRATRLELIPERAAVVKEIFELSSKGKGNIVIANILNERKEPTWGTRKNSSKTWFPAVIGNILRNVATYGTLEVCCGEQQFTAKRYYPPAVSKQLFNKAQLSRKERKTHRSTALNRKATIGLKVEIDNVITSFCYAVRKNKTKGETVNYYYRRNGKSVPAMKLESLVYDAMANGKVISATNKFFKKISPEESKLRSELQLLYHQRSDYEYMIQHSTGDTPRYLLDQGIKYEQLIEEKEKSLSLLQSEQVEAEIAAEARSTRMLAIKRAKEDDREVLKSLYSATIDKVVIEDNKLLYIQLHGNAYIDVGAMVKHPRKPSSFPS